MDPELNIPQVQIDNCYFDNLKRLGCVLVVIEIDFGERINQNETNPFRRSENGGRIGGDSLPRPEQS
jgi:hypothetical protein